MMAGGGSVQALSPPVLRGVEVRVASLVFGLTAGLVGIAIMLLLLVVGGIALALRADGWGEIVAHLMVTVVIAGIGMVGAALAPNRPGASAVLQSLAAVSGLFTAGLFWLLSAGLFCLGAFTGALAWWRARRRGAG